ncbi:MAG: hypothetical protein WBC51_07685 [Vicinamibacterales bacterium]
MADQVSAKSLNAGDWVEVRSQQEILATLDQKGQLDGMPFMPEMFAFCGRRFRVFARAHKTCDTVNDYKGRKLEDSVHLADLRCDGGAHGGCEAGCLIFWKTAWLRPVSEPGARPSDTDWTVSDARSPTCTEADVIAATVQRGTAGTDGPAYACQATLLPAYTKPLPAWELSQYVEDYASGNTGLRKMLGSFLYMAYHHWLVNAGIGIGPPLRWLYDRWQKLWGGVPYPRIKGGLPLGERTPSVALNLQPGEWVKVKSRDEILATCDEGLMNRGMKFDAELVPYCGGVYRVQRRLTKIINEKTGVMQHMKTPCIILDSVVCQARYADCRLFCPRSIYLYWREIWLERTDRGEAASEGPRA